MSSTSKIVIAVVIVAIVAVGVVLAFRQKTPQPQTMTPRQQAEIQAQTTVPPAQTAPTTPTTTGLTVTVNLAAQNNSGESGTATLTEMEGGKTKVVLNLSGAPQGIVQPAHIHAGACPNPGAVVFPLTFPTNGQSETILDVSLRDGILGRLPLAVNVHKSASEANVYFSCGDIKNPSAPAPQTVAPSTGQQAAPPAQVNDDRQGGGGTFSTPTDRRRGADKPED